jgi:hypothetical protein
MNNVQRSDLEKFDRCVNGKTAAYFYHYKKADRPADAPCTTSQVKVHQFLLFSIEIVPPTVCTLYQSFARQVLPSFLLFP